jgi:hypothetical protein
VRDWALRGLEFRVSRIRDHPAEQSQRIEEVVGGVLESIQDDIIEFVVRSGWPPVDPAEPDAPQSAAELPRPYVRIAERVLTWGFGDPAQPSLALTPIRLDDVRLP